LGILGLDEAQSKHSQMKFSDSIGATTGTHRIQTCTRIVADQLYKERFDQILYSHEIAWFEKKVFEGQWYEPYNILQKLVQSQVQINGSNRIGQQKYYEDTANRILERELSGYRFVDGLLIPISNEIEVAEIHGALKGAFSKLFGYTSNDDE
jgi:AbiJ N-terminal domain 4